MSHNDFAIDDYKLSLEYLQGQFQRLWQRFNCFLTVQLALFGLIGAVTFKQGALALNPIPLISALGLLISIIWYMAGAEDRFLVRVYRDRVMLAAERIGRIESLDFKGYEYSFVGIEADSGMDSPLDWYWRPVSITRLPVWLALLFGVAWLALLVNGENWLKPILATALVT